MILVPVSLGGSTAAAERDPGRPGRRARARAGSPDLVRSWAILLGLGLVLLVGALLLADRLGRSFVRPMRALASYAARLGVDGPLEPAAARRARRGAASSASR